MAPKSAVAAVLLSSFLQVAEAVHGGVITVNCSPLTIQRADPIISPGVVSSHVHIVTGGTKFQATESSATAISGKHTTCDKILDNSNYWQPQLYHHRTDGQFELVTMQGNAAYYIDRACDYAPGRQNCDTAPSAIAPPAGLRMVVGTPTLRTYDASNPEQRAISHECLQASTSFQVPSLPNQPCLRLRAQTFFPSCWDGQNLDSTDHKSHMAFPAIGDYNAGVCPQSHPRAILSVFFEFFYDTSKFTDFNRYVYAMGDPTGYGLHGDFLNGWTDQNRLNNALNTCTGPNGVTDPGCSLNVGPNGPGQSQVWPLEVAPLSNEQVGSNGPIATLPGNNPITGTFPN